MSSTLPFNQVNFQVFMGKQASIAIESSSRPKNSKHVMGQMFFLGWNDRPKSLASDTTQSIAELASWRGVEGLNMGKKSSR